ncbi:MAG: hypothetical protein HRU20_12025 [Pseudomonadales bacterium]|nr:hypothetical protein [Pseudomonadales bacterium]
MRTAYRALCTLFFIVMGLLPGVVNADLVIVVNEKNSTQELTMQQVRNIFLGRVLEFPNGQAAIPVIQPEGSQDRRTFMRRLIHKSESQVNAYWARLMFSGNGSPPRELRDAEEMLNMVSLRPNMIGYMHASKVDHRGKIVFRLQTK